MRLKRADRALGGSLAARRRALLAVALLSCTICGSPGGTSDAQHPRVDGEQYERAALIRLEGMITSLMETFLERKLEAAKQQGVDLVILEIDSPGGFTLNTLNMADHIREVEWARTVAFVPRQAISGGAILCLACDELVMAPGALLGDAGQIMMGEDNYFRYVPEKERSVLVGRVRDLAQSTGRPPALAEAMVDMDLVVYRARHRDSGDESFLSESEFDSLPDTDAWERLEPVHESREKQFLTVNGDRAVELQLAAATASTRDELVMRYPSAAPLLVLEPGAVDWAVIVLNWPLITGLIFVVGLVALYIELSAPGIGAGGLVAGFCFSLFFWSRFLGGTAGWLEVIVFAAGVIFVAMEFFVIPGFGIAGLSGLVLMVIGVLMASQHFVIPSTERELGVTIRGLAVIAGSGVVFLFAAAALSRYFHAVPVLGWLALEAPGAESSTPIRGKSGLPPVQAAGTRFPVQVGDWGHADSPLRPAGKARFADTYVDVVTDGTFVDAGQQVRVIEMSGNRVVVRQIDETSAERPGSERT